MQQVVFRGYRLDRVTRQLFTPEGAVAALTGRAFEVLDHLVAHNDRVVAREELLATVWQGRVVEENNLSQAIATLRRVFGTDASDRLYLMTVAGRGYRFVAPLDPDPIALRPESTTAAAVGDAEPPAVSRQSGVTRWRAWFALAAIAVLAGLFAFGVDRRDAKPEATTAARARLAVLPFRPLGSGSEDAMLELGLADTLIARLGQTTDLQVLSLGSVERFLGEAVDPLRAARELRADYVLEGSTQRNGQSIRVNARLLSVRDGRSLWTGTLDARPERVFTLQDVLATAVSGALSLRRHPARAVYRSPCDGEDAVAYRAYLQGRHLMFRPDPVGLPKALRAFDDALARDPACARAWAGKAFAYRSMAMVGDLDPGSAFAQARAAVEQALRIDPRSAEAYASKGVIEFWHGWDWAASEASLRHAIALDPNLAEAHYALAHLLHNIGRNDEGLPHFRQAALLNPLSPLINTIGASFLVSAGHVEEANQRVDAVLDLDPDFWTALFWKAQLRARSGDMAGALANMERASDACRRCSHALAGLAWLKAGTEDTVGAAALLAEMEARDARGYFPATRLALAHQALGHREKALDMLERAHAERDLYLTFLLVDDRWRGLHDEPRFRALLARMRLPILGDNRPAAPPASG